VDSEGENMITKENNVREEVKKKYKNQEAINLVEQFLKTQSKVGLSRKVSLEKELKEKTDDLLAIKRELGIIAVSLCRLKNQFLFLNLIITTKLTHLIRSIVFALNDNNPLLLALCSRSLIEHAASLSYLMERNNKMLNKAKASKDYKSVSDSLEELHAVYRKMFYGTRFFKKEGLIESVNVKTLYETYLSKEIINAVNYYDYLSDFVHPNFGSNILISSGELGEGIIDPSIEEKKEIIENILQITGILIKYLSQKVWDFANIGVTLDNVLQKAINPKTTLTSLFAEPGLEHTGDGLSKETAIFFTKPRTKFDHMKI
jgi:hypothetical protein